MKKIFLALAAMTISLCGMAQISTSVTLSGTPIAGSPFASFSAAITAVNGLTITGPVVVSASSGQTETLTGPLALTATGTAANTILITNSGSGAHPKLFSYTGTVATPAVTADGFMSIIGGDYITIDGIDLEETAANTTPTTVMEYGYQLLKASPSDGAQYNTIKNCVIKLSNVQNGSWTGVGHNGSAGINILNVLPTATAAVTPTAASGSNSFNKIYANTISNCNAGIVFIGYVTSTGVGPNPDPTTFLGDIGNDVGGNTAANGNSITNFGGGASTNPATGIFASNQWSMNVSYNTIDNNTGSNTNHATTLRGMFLNSGSTSASATVKFNNVSIKGGGTTTSVFAMDIEFGGTPAGNTLDISNNTISNCSYLTATSGAFYPLYCTTNPENLIMNYNTIDGFTGGVAATSGSYYGLYSSGTGAFNLTLKYNTVKNINTSVATGTCYGINWASPAVVEAAYNLVTNFTKNGSGTLNGLGSGSSSLDETVYNNTVSNINGSGYTGSTSQSFYCLTQNTSTGTKRYYNNTVNNIQVGSTSTSSILYGIRVGYGTLDSVYNNTVTNLSGAATIYGLYLSGVTASAVYYTYNNILANFTGTTAASTSGIIGGIYLAGGTATHYCYNNMISGLTGPGANYGNAMIGINASLSGVGGTAYITNNTINFNNPLTSTGTNFGGAGIYVGVISSTMNIENNIIRFQSATASGTGYFAALKRTSGTAGTKP